MLSTEPHFKYKNSEMLKECKKIYYANIDQKKTGLNFRQSRLRKQGKLSQVKRGIT